MVSGWLLWVVPIAGVVLLLGVGAFLWRGLARGGARAKPLQERRQAQGNIGVGSAGARASEEHAPRAPEQAAPFPEFDIQELEIEPGPDARGPDRRPRGAGGGVRVGLPGGLVHDPAIGIVPPPSRYVDVTLFEDNNRTRGPRMEPNVWLQVDSWYQLEVAVRQNPTGLVRMREAEPINDPHKDAKLLVALDPQDEDAVEIDQLVQPMVLPAMGDSTQNAIFRLRPKRADAGGSTLSCQVRVYYLLNLIEVGIVTFHVLTRFAKPRTSPGASAYEQRRRERDFGQLKETQPRDLAIDVTKDDKGYRLTFTFDGRERLSAGVTLPTTDLVDSLVRLRGALATIAMSPKFKTQLSADSLDFQSDLRQLAVLGRRLWVKLFKRPQTALGALGQFLENNQVSKDALISITVEQGATEFVFPWNLLYDREVAEAPAKVDPGGFWGLRYRIEQRLPIMGMPDRVFATSSPITLDFVFNDTFTNSKLQVDLIDQLGKSSNGALQVSIPPFNDAEKYKKRLDEGQAEILYFYCHGFARPRQSDTVADGVLKDIAKLLAKAPPDAATQQVFAPLLFANDNPDRDRSWIEPSLAKLYLDELEDLNPRLVSQPLVILNLCESAQVTPSLSESFVEFFLSHGATTIIGTECVMTTTFAHPFSEQLLRGILEAREVGQVLLEARRHFMDLQNPLGLAYTLYGSAATKLESAVV